MTLDVLPVAGLPSDRTGGAGLCQGGGGVGCDTKGDGDALLRVGLEREGELVTVSTAGDMVCCQRAVKGPGKQCEQIWPAI